MNNKTPKERLRHDVIDRACIYLNDLDLITQWSFEDEIKASYSIEDFITEGKQHRTIDDMIYQSHLNKEKHFENLLKESTGHDRV